MCLFCSASCAACSALTSCSLPFGHSLEPLVMGLLHVQGICCPPQAIIRIRGSSKGLSYRPRRRSCLYLRSRVFLSPGTHYRRGGDKVTGSSREM